ncbi:TPA: hypothetical protein I8622_005299 [Klebsiella oxytoca]|uniref:hypothetical protein n=1 Tax=Klebsiella pneumoniae TaxID=573 RepID=UPI0007CC3766|nr:hypothetical protein [Klebsiella pneumoniae]EKX1746673.1 hypothetical protein [Klebsiella oxytoca]MCI8106189.1 hypothetical protein [Klebsiella pneumoniae]MCS6330033.1 hypothetical protein [Klebsiella pneumoniae]MCW9309515.1 hypothetical protein [Klebsiella pneumoniae]MCW9320585.1 hypothetical protein [Klebsiella pneumoniae]
MIKKFFLLALSLSLSGCALSPNEAINYQKEHDFENVTFQTKSNERLSVFNLRYKFKNTTGMELPNQNTYECQRDALCYYGKYASAYDSLMEKYQEEKDKQNKIFAKQKEAECQASKECMAKREIDAASYTLNNVYYSLMARYPYQQADSDAGVRHMCRVAGAAQREGVTLEFMKQHISLTEGIGPEMRYQIIQVAEACWKMSKYGVPDGTTQIKSMY